MPYITLVHFWPAWHFSRQAANPAVAIRLQRCASARPRIKKLPAETPAEQLTKMSFILNCFSSPPKPTLILARGGSKGIPEKYQAHERRAFTRV